MNFFIFSLPRSGSAWLSVFFTHGNAFCYHEPLAESQPLSVLFNRPGIVGAIDTLAYTRPEFGRCTDPLYSNVTLATLRNRAAAAA